ncbi:MAG: hypothetical protein V2J24_20945, partial [Pseudomonadales bacterium]|nr:hypothetical protein [Pseudomonadales bacterium]
MQSRSRSAPHRCLIAAGLCLALALAAPARAQEIPQIPAFLPGIDQVPATQAMPLDGTWLISSIRKKIRI